MSKHTNEQSTDNLLDLQVTLAKAEKFYQSNRNLVTGIIAALILLPVGYIVLNKYVWEPKEQEAYEAMFTAERYFEMDSFNLALNGNANFTGFTGIIDEFGGTDAGNLAKYYAGICYVRMGQFQEGIDHLEKFSSDDILVSSIAFGTTGDAYRELGDSEKAVKCYEKAATRHPNNFTTPIYLKKAGMTCEEDLKDLDNAIKYYSRIETEYPNTREGQDIAKYLMRAKMKKGEI